MSSTQAYAGVKAALEALVLTGSPDVLDFEQFDPQAQQGDGAWIALEEAFSSESLETYGCPDTNHLLEDGALTVHVYSPIAASGGMAVTRALADEIRTGLRWADLSDGLHVRNIMPAYPSAYVGRWNAMEFTVEYERRFTDDLI